MVLNLELKVTHILGSRHELSYLSYEVRMKGPNPWVLECWVLIQHDLLRNTLREYHGRIWGEESHLHIKEQGLRKNQSCSHFLLKKKIFI